MDERKIMSLLGFAQKAGKIVSGETGVRSVLKSQKTKLLLIAADSSENTKKTYTSKAQAYNVVCIEALTKEQLGASVGKIRRSAVAVTDAGFAKAILALFT